MTTRPHRTTSHGGPAYDAPSDDAPSDATSFAERAHTVRFAAVAFDCDSTLSAIEGIDELARRVGRADEIAPLTTMAMDGRLPIEAVYARRMEIVRPDRAALDWLAEAYIEHMTPGAPACIAALVQAGIAVHLVSGGLRPAILPLARRLGIVDPRVHAVDVGLDAHGAYVDFDAGSPLTRADGKAEILAELVARYGPTVLVGDGITDVAAKAGGAFVVGYGGVVAREAVRAGADIFVTDPDLTSLLPLLIGPPDAPRGAPR